MVGSRCYEKIGGVLAKWGMFPEVSQGVVDFHEEPDGMQQLQLKEVLWGMGYEVVDDLNSERLNEVSDLVKKLIYQHPEIPITGYPEYLLELRLLDDEIIQVFSQVHGIELVQYATIQQVERIKEMLLYEDRKLKEIAEIFQFKSKGQLKRTFERITGLTPKFYKEVRKKRLKIREENGFGEKTGVVKEITRLE
jgi:AraC-like DNA-binding protein